MKKVSKREQSRIKQQRRQQINRAVWAGAAVLVVGVIAILAWQSFKPASGETVTVPAGFQTHVAIGTQLTYPSNPPAGGMHYDQTFKSGFYDEKNLPTDPGDPRGYLVHDLEHGYVILWYNCSKLDQAGCDQLKTEIKQVMDARNNIKLIAFPWTSTDVPLVMTSWGKLQRFQAFDQTAVNAFIANNLNRSPEPEAP